MNYEPLAGKWFWFFCQEMLLKPPKEKQQTISIGFSQTKLSNGKFLDFAVYLSLVFCSILATSFLSFFFFFFFHLDDRKLSFGVSWLEF